MNPPNRNLTLLPTSHLHTHLHFHFSNISNTSNHLQKNLNASLLRHKHIIYIKMYKSAHK